MKKILIADYDPKNLTYLQALLAGKGFEVQTANNGQDAVERFQNWNPDLVILEPMLPKLHGFEVCKRIKSGPRSDVPLIWCTKTYKGKKYRNEALQKYQAFEHLERPVADDVLLKVVGRALGVDLSGPKPSMAEGTGASAEASAAAKTTGRAMPRVDRDALLREMRQIGRKEKKTKAPEPSPEETTSITAQALESIPEPPPKKTRKTDIKKARASLKRTLKDLKKTRRKKQASPYGLKKTAEHLDEQLPPEEPERQEAPLPQAPVAPASEDQLFTSEDLFGDILAEETPPEFEYPSKAKPETTEESFEASAEDEEEAQDAEEEEMPSLDALEGAVEGEGLEEKIAAEDGAEPVEADSFEEEVEELSDSLEESQGEEAPEEEAEAEEEEGEDFEQEEMPSLDALDALEGAVEGEGLEEKIAAEDEAEPVEADSSEEAIEELSEPLEESQGEEAPEEEVAAGEEKEEGEDFKQEEVPSLDALDALEGAVEGGNLPDELFADSEEEQDLEESPSGEEFDEAEEEQSEEEQEEEISEELEPAVSEDTVPDAEEADSSSRVVELHDEGEEEEVPALEALDAMEGMVEGEELPENATEEEEEESPGETSGESESDEETEDYKTQALDAEHPEERYATLPLEETEEASRRSGAAVQEEENVPAGEGLPSLPEEDIAASEKETSASAPEEIPVSKKEFLSEEEAIDSLDEVFDASEPAAQEAPEEAEEGEAEAMEPFEAVEEKAEEAAEPPEPPEEVEEERQVAPAAEEEVSKDSTAQIERDEFLEEMRKKAPLEEVWAGAEEEKAQEESPSEEDSSSLEIESVEEVPREEAAREEPAVEEAEKEQEREEVVAESEESDEAAPPEPSEEELSLSGEAALETAESVELESGEEISPAGDAGSEKEEESSEEVNLHFAPEEDEQEPSFPKAEEEEPSLLVDEAATGEPVEEGRQAPAVSAEAAGLPSEEPKEEKPAPTLAELAEVAARPMPSLQSDSQAKGGKFLKIAASLAVVVVIAVAGYLFRDAVSEKIFRFRGTLFEKDSRGASESLEAEKEAAPPPAPVSSEPLKNLEGVKKPQPLQTTTPLLPQDSEVPSGTQVFVSAHITAEGGVKEARTVHNPSDEPALSGLAEAEVLAWTFVPAEKDGRKVAVWLTVPVSFVRGELVE